MEGWDGGGTYNNQYIQFRSALGCVRKSGQNLLLIDVVCIDPKWVWCGNVSWRCEKRC